MSEGIARSVVDDLQVSLRAGAAGSYAAEAAVELLIRHGVWLARDAFVVDCLRPLDETADFVGVDWSVVVRHVRDADAPPAARAVALIAAQLGAVPDPADTPVDVAAIGPLAWLLASLDRPAVDLVLAAISHAAGTHQNVEHLVESVEVGEPARATTSSVRLRLGPLHDWPVQLQSA